MKELPKIQLECRLCGAPFEVHPYRRFTAMFCTALCRNTAVSQSTARQRGNAMRFRGAGKGYVKFHGRHMHRVIAERKLGRPLKKGEIVHHDNLNKRDNRRSNIKVLKSQSVHAKLHDTKRKKGRFCAK